MLGTEPRKEAFYFLLLFPTPCIPAPRLYLGSMNSTPHPRPRIAIPQPTSTDVAYNQRSWPQYAGCVERSGGEPVEIPLNAAPVAIANLINTCQAVLLPGSP